MQSAALFRTPIADALGKQLHRDIEDLTSQWQNRLELEKNNISIFVPVEKRRKGLRHLLDLLARCMKDGGLQPFHAKIAALARLRATQGFNLKDSLEEALTLQDILFAWARHCAGSERDHVLESIAICHKVSHKVLSDIARIHSAVLSRHMRARQQESYTDGLTHLFNHRFFKEFLQKEIYRSARYQHPATLVLIDVDWFKKINDRLGHMGGDQVLLGLAQLAKGNCRITDLVCRYGGEEFAILLPETPKDQAILYCERFRKKVEAHAFSIRHSPEALHITVSVGMANYPEDAQDAMDLIRKADQAMYMAKKEGRNRVYYYSQDGALKSPLT